MGGVVMSALLATMLAALCHAVPEKSEDGEPFTSGQLSKKSGPEGSILWSHLRNSALKGKGKGASKGAGKWSPFSNTTRSGAIFASFRAQGSAMLAGACKRWKEELCPGIPTKDVGALEECVVTAVAKKMKEAEKDPLIRICGEGVSHMRMCSGIVTRYCKPEAGERLSRSKVQACLEPHKGEMDDRCRQQIFGSRLSPKHPPKPKGGEQKGGDVEKKG